MSEAYLTILRSLPTGPEGYDWAVNTPEGAKIVLARGLMHIPEGVNDYRFHKSNQELVLRMNVMKDYDDGVINAYRLGIVLKVAEAKKASAGEKVFGTSLGQVGGIVLSEYNKLYRETVNDVLSAFRI